MSQTILNGISSGEAKVVPAGTGPAYCGPGNRITFLITGAETGGALFVAETLVAPGGGPPPHVHTREEESFYVQEGTLELHVGDKVVNATAGDFIHVPRGVTHWFRNPSRETTKMLTIATPAGLENFFAESFLPAADIADIPQSNEALIVRAKAAASRYGLELFPPVS